MYYYYVLLLVLHIDGFGSNWDLDLPIWLQPKSIWTDLDPFGLAQKPNVFGNQFVQIPASPKARSMRTRLNWAQA